MTTITVPTWFLYIALSMWGTTIVIDILLLIAKRQLAKMEVRSRLNQTLKSDSQSGGRGWQRDQQKNRPDGF